MRDTVEMHHGKCVCVSFLTRPIQGLKTQDILVFAALISSDLCIFFMECTPNNWFQYAQETNIHTADCWCC